MDICWAVLENTKAKAGRTLLQQSDWGAAQIWDALSPGARLFMTDLHHNCQGPVNRITNVLLQVSSAYNEGYWLWLPFSTRSFCWLVYLRSHYWTDKMILMIYIMYLCSFSALQAQHLHLIWNEGQTWET